MKTIENVTLYKCDFCKKELRRKHAMVNHECKCDKNPKNEKACWLCKYCKKVPHVYVVENDEGYDQTVRSEKFHCATLEKDMYPYKAEYMDLPKRFPETFDGQFPMPKYCDSFRAEWE